MKKNITDFFKKIILNPIQNHDNKNSKQAPEKTVSAERAVPVAEKQLGQIEEMMQEEKQEFASALFSNTKVF